MGKIDSAGTFKGTIAESGVGVTSKSGFPQWVARLLATQKYISDEAGMKHFGLTEPGWVDWSQFAEEIVAYMVLFKSKEEFSDATKMLNYEQLQIATGWDGTEFDSLGNGTLVGKEILFRVEENSFEGKTSLQVNWIDSLDASPERTLKTLDADKVKGLNSLLKITKAKPAAAPAKPASKPAATKPAPAAPAATTPPPAPTTPAAAPPVAETPAAPKPPKASKKAAPAPAPAEETPAYPAETTQMDAWNAVLAANKGGDDAKLQDAWIESCQEVGEERDEDTFTPGDWAKVRDGVLRRLTAA